MKTITIISVVQIAAILLLFSKIVDIEEKLDRPAGVELGSSISGDWKRAAAPVDPGSNYPSVSEDRWRQIVREELVAQLADLHAPERQAAASAVLPPADPMEMASRREFVAQQLQYFSSVGNITIAEMQQLQADIARLDPASRTEMLRELTRALNSGRLEGHL